MKKTYMLPIVEKIFYVEEGHLLISTANTTSASEKEYDDDKVGTGGGNDDDEGAKQWGQVWEWED